MYGVWRWNRDSSSAAVIRLEVGLARMEAVRGCDLPGSVLSPEPAPSSSEHISNFIVKTKIVSLILKHNN